MNDRHDFDALPMVLDISDIQNALGISRHGALKLFSSESFPALEVMQRKLILKTSFIEWLNYRKEVDDNGSKASS